MKTVGCLLSCVLLLGRIGLAAPKQHVVAFGKWTTVKWMVGEDESTASDLKIRPLLMDGQSKEVTTGLPHEVTDHTFVVQRVFRLNDTLPHENTRWRWERGGWLLVNRRTGKVLQISLPEFDPYCSAAGWFRDYVAHCGISDDGKKASAIIVPAQASAEEAHGWYSQCDAGVPCPNLAARAPLRVTLTRRVRKNSLSRCQPGRWTWFQKKKMREKNKKTHGVSEPNAACNAARRTT